MKRFMLAVVMAISALNVKAQSVIRGEVSPGVYQTMRVTADGALYTTPASAAVTSSFGTVTGTMTDRSGVIAVANTSQVAVPVNLNRRYLLIQNTSDTDLWFNFTNNATINAPSIRLMPYGSFVMETKFISTEALNVISSVAGKTYSIKEF